jgi:hypothetical protein
MADDKKPVEEDIRTDDHEFNPAMEPKSAKAWLNLLIESEDTFEPWNKHCDNIDKQYANLERLATMSRQKEFQMFWANCEVLKPSIYAKPPIPVVVPKFKDRRPVYQAASEVMERCTNVAFDLTRINDLMLLVRDDLSMTSRGVAWCRYESGRGDSSYDHEKVCIDFKGRRDFLHSISRNWREVTWVAGASYLTRSEARDRFKSYSGEAYQEADYRVDKDSKTIGGADNRERAKFWEIWHKPSRRVVWVAEGVEDILDEDDAHLDLQNFFPCPKPAYGTVQRGSLVPVPDVMQYKDQLEEINLLTGRIHALSDALEAKGFYPAGGAEIADAVQTAISVKTPGRMLIPISNWAAFGGSKEVIIWLPIDMIATTITGLVALRKQVIEDIYQIMGLSDIMRGATDPNETLGAQQLKTQYGSTRIRDKQQEMVRLARDLVEITSEIIAEEFQDKTIVEMSQTQLPTIQMQKQKMQQIVQGIQQGQQLLPTMPPDQAQQAQQMMQMAQAELQKIQQEPTLDQVMRFLRDNRAKAFVLDIETDSTILQDENAEKQRRTEFVQVLGQLLPQLSSMITAEPKTAEFCGEILKFATAPYRSGRSLEGAIDEMIEQFKAKGEQPAGDDPETAKGKVQIQIEQMKQQTEKAKLDQTAQFKRVELLQKDQHKQWELDNELKIKQAEMQAKQGDRQAEMVQASQEQAHDREVHQMEMIKKDADVRATQQKSEMAMQIARAKMQSNAQAAQSKQALAQQKAMQPQKPRPL